MQSSPTNISHLKEGLVQQGNRFVPFVQTGVTIGLNFPTLDLSPAQLEDAQQAVKIMKTGPTIVDVDAITTTFDQTGK